MADDRIRYDILVQEAARGVIRKVLQETAQAGLPGDHHFFITFVTNAPGVRISSALRERYPEQMTIVIQHQYWDLKAHEKGFEVVLSFSDVLEKLEIPYTAIRGFYDPHANFEMEFDDVRPASANEAQVQEFPREPEADKPAKPAKAEKPARKREEPAKPEGDAPAAGKGAEVVSLDAFRKK
ncbi:SspB family protein [Chelativorans composti]|uniref:SspB family protein n=1 Tax=Chelativorans composti TaxID=768533 RepID=A0ABW5DM74_9HYPH